mgnify:CR=1 FL=1|jgi:hypothetical protein
MKKKIFFVSLTLILFAGCSKKTYTGSIYLVGFMLGASGIPEQEYIENQALPKDLMKQIQYGTEVIVEKDNVIEVYDYNYGRRSSKKNEHKPFKLKTSRIDLLNNTLYTIKKSLNSESYLGGKKPDEVILPFLNDEIYFQYFGKLNKDEFPNKLLNFDLHLIAPIYDSFDKIYLDYSNETSPKVLNPNSLNISKTFDETNSKTEIIYEKSPIKYEKGGSIRYSLGNTGVPSWIQNAEYPICPKNGDKMKFLIAFDLCENREEINLEYTSFERDEDSERYFKNLDFWGCGSIYIFINPKTKVICYFLQNT